MDMLYLGDRPGLQGIGGNFKLLVWHADPNNYRFIALHSAVEWLFSLSIVFVD